MQPIVVDKLKNNKIYRAESLEILHFDLPAGLRLFGACPAVVVVEVAVGTAVEYI